jgi:peptide/nickel transport system permease protein
VTAFVARRLIGMVLVLAVVSFVTFIIFIANIKEAWGFDKPWYVQYKNMMQKAFVGPFTSGTDDDLYSEAQQLNVVDQIKQGVPVTFSLAIGAGIIWLSCGVLVGVFSAVKAGKAVDRGLTTFALIGVSMPVFWLGLELRYFLAERNSWFPDGGYVKLTDDPVQWFVHLLLPWLCLAVLFIGFYGRVLRSNILDTINEDYVRTARAKGLGGRVVMTKHVLRNSLIPIVTLFGLDFGAVLGGGAILTETVFDLHGVGQYAAQSITNADLPPIMGVVLYGAFFIVLFSAIVDFLYARLDPRIRPT